MSSHTDIVNQLLLIKIAHGDLHITIRADHGQDCYSASEAILVWTPEELGYCIEEVYYSVDEAEESGYNASELNKFILIQ